LMDTVAIKISAATMIRICIASVPMILICSLALDRGWSASGRVAY
jgi:hypothetical protein